MRLCLDVIVIFSLGSDLIRVIYGTYVSCVQESTRAAVKLTERIKLKENAQATFICCTRPQVSEGSIFPVASKINIDEMANQRITFSSLLYFISLSISCRIDDSCTK